MIPTSLADLNIPLVLETLEFQRGFHRKKFHKLEECLAAKGVEIRPETQRAFYIHDAELTRCIKLLIDYQRSLHAGA